MDEICPEFLKRSTLVYTPEIVEQRTSSTPSAGSWKKHGTLYQNQNSRLSLVVEGFSLMASALTDDVILSIFNSNWNHWQPNV